MRRRPIKTLCWREQGSEQTEEGGLHRLWWEEPTGHYHRSVGDVLAWDGQLQLSHQVRPEASADGGARTRERLRGRLTKGCFCSPVLLTRSSVEPWKIRS
ncbi:hypothetical protein LEMLEM_LOCUS27687 [Lemmus lemmus]